MKKLIALLLASVMLLGLLAGCNQEEQKPSVPGNSDPQQQSDPQQTGEPQQEVVTLKWVTVGGGMPVNYESWVAKLNAYLEDKIGVHVEMEVVGWGDWDQRRNMIVSTNEPYDIIFGNNGNFNPDVSMGALADITDLLDKVPTLRDFIPESYWEACKVDGKLYAVPSYKDSSATFFFVYDEGLAKASGADYKNAHTFAEVAKVVEAMYNTTTENHAAGETAFWVGKMGVDAIYGSKYDDISSGCPAVGVSYTGGEAKVVSVFEQEDVIADLAVLQDMYAKGLINSDANIRDEVPKYNPCGVGQGWPYAAKTTWGPNMRVPGLEAIAIQWGETVLSNATVQGSLNCISAACKYPEKALQLLELVNTDSKVRDMFFYGEEGVNFEYTAEGFVHKLPDAEPWTLAGYTQGSFFTVTPEISDEDFKAGKTEVYNQWDEVKAQNENATPSPILGFSLDVKPIESELKAVGAIFQEWRAPLMTGADPSAREQMLAAMYDAGLQTVIDGIQAQVDAWVAAK